RRDMAADPLDRTVRTRLPLAALLVLAVLLSALPAGAVGDVNDTINIVRPVGSNPPADVAIRLSQATFGDGGADHALLATDAAFADALASGTLQADDTPLLLTGRTSLRTDVATELQRLGVEDVTILGGEAAVDDDVVEDLEDLGI